MADTIPFVPWRPDLSPLGTGSAAVVSGCVPRSDGWGPYKSFQALTEALPALCRGYYYARRSDGSIAVFAGTETHLYLLNNTTFAWEVVSQGASPYSALVPEAQWQFRQFNDLVIAVQANTVPQKFTLSSSTEFEDLGGSPPQAAHIAIVNRFVVLSGLLSNPRRLQWCDLDAPETWTAGTGLADFQDLADGGGCKRVSGGDNYGVIFQEEAIRSMTYAPGSAVVFQIVRLATQDTLYAEYSVVEAGSRTFFLSAQGFKVIEPGGIPTAIGKDQVDAWFFANVDNSLLRVILGATDPAGTRVFWSFKSTSGDENLFDMLILVDFALKPMRWGLIPQSGEYLASLAKPGITLEQLDPVAPTPLTITGAADNGSGAIRLEVAALSNDDFSLGTVGNPSQNFCVVYDVLGTTEANGTWPYTIVDATHIDLTGSTFANAYASGGQIGGSLDELPFSLDSVSKSAISQLSVVNSEHKAGFFSGPNMEAIMETEDQDGKGNLLFVTELLPMTDASDAMMSLGNRMRQQSAPSYSTESAIESDGYSYHRVESRYIRARMRVPAAATWTYAQGIQPTGQLSGEH